MNEDKIQIDTESQEPLPQQNNNLTANEDTIHPTLSEAIEEQSQKEEKLLRGDISFRDIIDKVLGGDILATSTIRNQIWVMLLITAWATVYISNRYSCQKDLIEIDKLTKELQDAKYRALSSNSRITEKSRESNVLHLLNANKDSTLKMPDQPPYIINVPEE